ncbi:MIP/aquaporin family protein [Commensalibacter nepenthis]|uniref:MIP/aquaporin family protein n=1 Tax=Commensalibacter nepenthis TaxID=3043872 RepID=A0ABT6Q8Y9_9PROT|nr:MIP/aquaporin family protein [Commensalibacter sp. TBRC 10068]MDI2112713.1 MIP/aquaporin family protein [Commensalibacter sp. TBRC 10068]
MSPITKFIGELISEAVAVAIIIFIGCSSAAMLLLYDPSPYQNAYWGVAIAWGLSVTFAIYATGSVSGTHANPAVTLALALYRGFSWRKVPAYCMAQIFGGICGAVLVYCLYSPVIDHYNTTHHITRLLGGSAGVFVTSPGLAITPIHAFYDEILLTAFLVFSIFAITESYNTVAPQANSGAFMIGLVVAAIGASAGYLEGWAINPARDLGPRIFIYLAGWGPSAFPGLPNYWWVPIGGPFIGGILGGGAYQLLIRPFLPRPIV